jgi:hypothetical protein
MQAVVNTLVMDPVMSIPIDNNG